MKMTIGKMQEGLITTRCDVHRAKSKRENSRISNLRMSSQEGPNDTDLGRMRATEYLGAHSQQDDASNLGVYPAEKKSSARIFSRLGR